MSLKGVTGFSQFFEEFYGQRWDSLKQSLGEKDIKVLRRNVFSNVDCDSLEEFENLENCYINDGRDLSALDDNDVRQFYLMDPASIIVARSLEVSSGDDVLDMCSAPGGKSLVLFEDLDGDGTLLCNEISKNRRERLKNVLREYIPDELRVGLSVGGKDGLRYGLDMPESFDKILVDAPCSGEKHLVQDKKELEKWSHKRTKRLSSTQYGLMCSALLATKSGGEIVYSTCSISPLEDDGVIEKLLKKKGESFELIELDGPQYELGEKTKYGVIFLPDKCGFGPLYLSKIKKN